MWFGVCAVVPSQRSCVVEWSCLKCKQYSSFSPPFYSIKLIIQPNRAVQKYSGLQDFVFPWWCIFAHQMEFELAKFHDSPCVPQLWNAWSESVALPHTGPERRLFTFKQETGGSDVLLFCLLWRFGDYKWQAHAWFVNKNNWRGGWMTWLEKFTLNFVKRTHNSIQTKTWNFLSLWGGCDSDDSMVRSQTLRPTYPSVLGQDWTPDCSWCAGGPLRAGHCYQRMNVCVWMQNLQCKIALSRRHWLEKRYMNTGQLPFTIR